MNNYSIGTPVMDAIITTRAADGSTSSVQLTKDDELTALTLANYPNDTVIDACTVKGFIVATKAIPRGPSSRVFDGIPTYMWDTDGGSHFGVAEEVLRVDKVLVEIPGESEDSPAIPMLVPVSRIKSFEGGTPVETGEDTDTGSEDAGTEP